MQAARERAHYHGEDAAGSKQWLAEAVIQADSHGETRNLRALCDLLVRTTSTLPQAALRTKAECEEGMPPDATSCLRSHLPSFSLRAWSAADTSARASACCVQQVKAKQGRCAPISHHLQALRQRKGEKRSCEREVGCEARHCALQTRSVRYTSILCTAVWQAQAKVFAGGRVEE